VAKESPQKKVRRLKAAPVTVRERAERAANTANKQPKQSRIRKVTSRATSPLRKVSGKVARIKIWKPFKFAGRIIARVLVPPYIRNSFHELRLVSWPNRKQTFQLTFAVLLFATAAGLLIAVFDFGLDKLFKQVILR